MSTAPAVSRAPRALAVLAGLLVPAVAVLAAVASGAITGPILVDPGPLVRWGLPIARAVHDAAAAVAVGLLVAAVLLAPGASRQRGGDLDGARAHLVRWATIASATWSVAALAVLVLTGADLLGRGPGAPGFTTGLVSFAAGVELGQALLAALLLAVVSAHLAAFARSLNTAGWALVAAVAALAALALSGHAGSSYDHANAVNTLAVHLVAVCAWAGGLVALVIAHRRLGEDLRVTAERFSALALGCFVAVAASGVLNAQIRLTGPEDLVTTAYGRMVALKALALIALGVFGAIQRRRVLPRLDGPRSGAGFARFAGVEALVLGTAMGLAVALSRTPTPLPQDTTIGAQARAEALVGHVLPPPFEASALLTAWQIDWVFLAVALCFAGFYIVGVVRLRRRGDAWPAARTAFWLAGCAVFLWTLNGAPNAYGMLRFDLHMVQHMLLMMVVPMLWVLGAPVTLLSRAVAPRTDGSRGVREWVLVALHSRYSQFLSHGPVAGVIFAGSLIVFYFTPVFEWTMFSHVGHVVMIVHFLLTGYLFCWVLIGIDPGPRVENYPLRLLILLITLAFHAFVGIAIISQGEIIGGAWYRALGLHGEEALWQLQQQGGSVMWALSEIPTVLLAMGVVWSWTRADQKEARRYDRRADRDQDAELQAYNEQLRRLAERDAAGGGR